MRKIYKIICSYFVLIVLLVPNLVANALSYPNYTINSRLEEALSPAAYVPERIIYGENAGTGAFVNPADIQDFGEQLYVLDAGRNSLFVLDKQFKIVNTIAKFEIDGKEYTFNNPQGFTISGEGNIYIADTDNSRIAVLDSHGKGLDIFNKPEIDLVSKDYVYKPLKVGVDKAKRIYVIAQGINEGLMELNSEGKFMGFLGAPRVTYDPLTYFWKKVLTKNQSKYLEKFVPTEFSNISVDSDGFIYTVIKSNDIKKTYEAIRANNQTSVMAVEKFNASGVDILKRKGEIPVLGDVNFQIDYAQNSTSKNAANSVVYNPSTFVDIAVDQNGNYFCLDSKRGRIFTYDADGNILYAFGSLGNQIGNFTTPVAVELFGDNLVVLDSALKRITVFSKTQYGSLINEAAMAYAEGNYKASLDLWNEVYQFNSNLSVAYLGIGKCYYYLQNYGKSVEYLKLAKEKYYCSKAFTKYRLEVMIKYSKTFLLILFFVILLIAGLIIGTKLIRKRRSAK